MARPRNFDESKILHQAMKVFWTSGYEATSLSMLLQATGLSKSSLYDSFGNKHELFLATFNLYHQERVDALNRYISNGENYYQGITDFFNSVLEHTEQQDGSLGCMSCNEAVELAPHDLQFRQLVEDDFQACEDIFFQAINDGKTEGSITSSEDSSALARFLLVSLQGLHVMARAQSNEQRLIDTITIILKTLR